MNKVPRWVFRYVGDKTFDFSSKKKDFLPKNDQIWPNIGIFGQFWLAMQAYTVPCWWVGWWSWRAGCISQDTYLHYVITPKSQCKKSAFISLTIPSCPHCQMPTVSQVLLCRNGAFAIIMTKHTLKF